MVGSNHYLELKPSVLITVILVYAAKYLEAHPSK